MRQKKCGKYLIQYEIRNLLGNPFIYFFGMVFPLLMLFLIARAIAEETPEAYVAQANTAVFISLTLIVPMAVIFIGYAANYAQELEKEIPVRMKLFGYRERSILAAKVAAHFLVLAAGLLLYTVVGYSVLDLQIPCVGAALCLLLCHILLGGIFFAIAHGIALLFKKFGPTYAVVMAIYFGIMILCGMMGVKTEMLPAPARQIAALLPMSYISNEFIDFWTGGSYNFAPLIQSFLFLGAAAGILLLAALQKQVRK